MREQEAEEKTSKSDYSRDTIVDRYTQTDSSVLDPKAQIDTGVTLCLCEVRWVTWVDPLDGSQ